MMSRSGLELPQLELDCLRVLWRLERANVGQIHEALAKQGRALAYTTVLTVLERLHRKEAVERRREGRAFLYRARLSREEMRRRALDRLVNNYFDSHQELRIYLQGETSPRTAVAPAVPTVEPPLETVLLD